MVLYFSTLYSHLIYLLHTAFKRNIAYTTNITLQNARNTLQFFKKIDYSVLIVLLHLSYLLQSEFRKIFGP